MRAGSLSLPYPFAQLALDAIAAYVRDFRFIMPPATL